MPVAFLAASNTTPSRLFIRPIALIIIVSTPINQLSDLGITAHCNYRTRSVCWRILQSPSDQSGFAPSSFMRRSKRLTKAQVEAITATGASRWQIMAYGIVPQILPAFAGIAVFRWDINIREVHSAGSGRRRWALGFSFQLVQ